MVDTQRVGDRGHVDRATDGLGQVKGKVTDGLDVVQAKGPDGIPENDGLKDVDEEPLLELRIVVQDDSWKTTVEDVLGDVGTQGYPCPRPDPLRFEELVDVDKEVAHREAFKLVEQLVYLGATLPDNKDRPRRVDVKLRLASGALNVNFGHARLIKTLLDVIAELQVFVQQVRVILTRIPHRTPRADHAQAKAQRMYLLTHKFSPYDSLMTS